MKKNTVKSVFGIVIVLLCVCAVVTPWVLNSAAEGSEKIIVIDPGHGGEDGGAVGDDGTIEKNLNLQIAFILKEELERAGYTVIMTRESDDDTDGLTGFHKKQDLIARAQTAVEARADIYLSIHCNASTSKKDQGFQVWYGTGNADGNALAQAIHDRVEQAKISTRVRAVKAVPATLYIFRTLTVPNVLIECGFLTNAEDRYQLKQETFHKKLAAAIREGIADYFSSKKETIT